MTLHNREDLFRYLSGDLAVSEREQVETHLKACPECADYLAFVRDFNSALKAMAPVELQPDTPCPDADTMVAFAAGNVDENTAQLLRQHTILCKDCLEELHLLRRATESARMKMDIESSEEAVEWRNLLEKAQEFVIDLAKSYGSGALVGSIRIVAEQPVPAVRGGGLPEVISKVLEVQVGENAYSTELTVTDKGVACDVAGFRTPAKARLNIAVRSGTGEELISTQTDDFGNSHFVIPAGAPPDDMYLLTLTLKDSEQQLLFRVPVRTMSG